MKITKEDIVMVLKDVTETIKCEWEMDDSDIYNKGLNGEESKYFAIDCVNKAIDLIKND